MAEQSATEKSGMGEFANVAIDWVIPYLLYLAREMKRENSSPLFPDIRGI